MLSGRRDTLIVLLLACATIVYALALPTRHFTPDAVLRLQFTETHNLFELWHSQHLLAQLPGYAAALALSPVLRAFQAIQAVDALLSGFTVAVIYLSARLLGASRRVAVGAGLALWFSYGFWHYSGDPDIYAPVILSVALLMLAFIRYRQTPTTGRLIWLGAAAGFAVLMHQLNVELAGLIGLLLVLGSTRHAPFGKTPRRHVLIYGGMIAGMVLLGYVVAWQSASGYFAQTTGGALSFSNWVVRYFNIASTSDTSWGKSFGFASLPNVGYALLNSWMLPPLRSQITVLDILILAAVVGGTVVWLGHLMLMLPRLSPARREIALLCLGTVVVNVVSAWWWQAGNIKFYLPMQINLILLAVIYIVAASTRPALPRRLAYVIVALPLAGLALRHVLATLPYETRSGMFVVADAIEASGTYSPLVLLDEPVQVNLLPMISRYPAALLASDYCTAAPPGSWIVLRDPPAEDCPALAERQEVAAFQADPSRQMWHVYAP